MVGGFKGNVIYAKIRKILFKIGKFDWDGGQWRYRNNINPSPLLVQTINEPIYKFPPRRITKPFKK